MQESDRIDGLLELIYGYNQFLRFDKPKHRSHPDVVEGYSTFARALIHIPNFPWTQDEMMQTTRVLLKQEFPIYHRYSIFDSISKRYAISEITDPKRREQVWVTAEYISFKNNLNLDPHLEPSDIPQILEDLKTMYFVYQDKISPEIKKIILLQNQLKKIIEYIYII